MSVNDILAISEPFVLKSERNLRILAGHIARERAQPLSEVINDIEEWLAAPETLVQKVQISARLNT